MKKTLITLSVFAVLSTLAYAGNGNFKSWRLACDAPHDRVWNGGALYQGWDRCREVKRMHDNNYHNKADIAYCRGE